MTQQGKTLVVHLWKNELKTVAIYPGQGYNMGTQNLVLQLKKNDRVYIRQGDSNDIYIHSRSDYNYSVFSGYLID